MNTSSKLVGSWHVTFKQPQTRRKYTLFGGGQHYGVTHCERCRKELKRNSGMQKFCGPWNDKNSCAYKNHLQEKKVYYITKLKNKQEKPIYLKNKTGKPSLVILCTCGNRYIKTREGQICCVECIHYQNMGI